MKMNSGLRLGLFLYLAVFSTFCNAVDKTVLEGTWRLASYFNAGDQTRYQSQGYMMFGKEHWLHVVYMNRDERAEDFAEAHHGTYKITGEGSVDLLVDMDMHMDPKKQFQETQIKYIDMDDIAGASYKIEGSKIILDFPSTAQIVMEKIE
ncbi:MAG: hypothetical protein HN764_01555 [Gammaproteobacteria bacterium]|jgi:hypothetical protein|nr:hypothetical protein [Gammaproteobacteria bacterium]